jgi:hypothetical protein
MNINESWCNTLTAHVAVYCIFVKAVGENCVAKIRDG